MAAEIGIDLSGHRALPVDASIVAAADAVYCATRDHVAEIHRIAGSGATVELLDPHGRDIDDPYGLDLAAYRRTRDEVVAAIDARLAGWEALGAGDG